MEGMGVDFAQPRLFGFECSRPEDVEISEKNNAYRHPERWGQPMVKFEKYHDVYSLLSTCHPSCTFLCRTNCSGQGGHMLRARGLETSNAVGSNET